MASRSLSSEAGISITSYRFARSASRIALSRAPGVRDRRQCRRLEERAPGLPFPKQSVLGGPVGIQVFDAHEMQPTFRHGVRRLNTCHEPAAVADRGEHPNARKER
jgi:hypothetical protein